MLFNSRWYSILGIRAPSRCGKSEYTKSLLDIPLTVNAEDAEYPNLREFDTEVHSGIVFDNVNNPDFI